AVAQERLEGQRRLMPALTDLLRPHQQRVDEISERMKYGMSQNIAHARSRFSSSAGALRPSILQQRLARSQERFKRLDLPVSLVQRPLDSARQRLDALWRLAEQVSPDGPLKRGYARVSAADGSLIANRAAALKAGNLDLHFQDGTIGASVTEAGAAKSKPAQPSVSRVKKAPDDRQKDLF
ncbi:exodeoxyribonuclease VII large subunit, partial [Parasphingorhabdus sp.]|uniref:exodeoxyribonuclease VII large subunit n=1 Tax=Parasphingorhabdus sp. TaxID=2709688 RepID=UPI003C748940